MMRCAGFIIAGFIGHRPVPSHGDFRCYLRGKYALGHTLCLAVVVLILGFGFLAGRVL